MSSYDQYGGNPYGTGEAQTGYGQAGNPYSSAPAQETGNTTYAYGQNQPAQQFGSGAYESYNASRPQPAQQPSTYSEPSNYGHASGMSLPTGGAPGAPGGPVIGGAGAPPPVAPLPMILSNQDFLARVDGIRTEMKQLNANVSEIGSLHQRILNTPDNAASAKLENLVAQTQILNTRIKDQIRQLELDAKKSEKQSGKNTTKDSQIRTLKSSFESQLQDYRHEETVYQQRYREQIARQYRIVNPEASDAEVTEAANANWGDEGVFQTALKSNRTGAATSVLGSVRARHNDIQQIEKTLMELNQLFEQLGEQVILQEEPIQQTEMHTQNVEKDTTAGNKQLNTAIDHAKRARKLKWWCFFIVVLIIVILALVLGLYFGLHNNN